MVDGMIPSGATHFHVFYGRTGFYKRVEYQHLNQVSEAWQTLVNWYWWDEGKWKKDTPPRLAKPIEELK